MAGIEGVNVPADDNDDDDDEQQAGMTIRMKYQ
jgi:hypothetical protein